MAAVGGDILEITANHPTLGAKTFFPKSAEDSNYDLGGLRSADEANGVDGSGAMIDQMNRVRWFFEVPVVNDTNVAKELEFVKALSQDPVPADWTFTLVNGSVYGGQGKPVGDIQGNANTAVFPLKVSGGADLEQIA